MTIQTPQPTALGSVPTCPRCEALLTQRFADTWPECIQCGYADYSQDLHRRGDDKVRLTAIRYGGNSPHYADTVVMTSVKRPYIDLTARSFGRQYQRTENKLNVQCPACDIPMAQMMSYSGQRKDKSALGFKCENNHVIVLFDPAGNWRSPDYKWRFSGERPKYRRETSKRKVDLP